MRGLSDNSEDFVYLPLPARSLLLRRSLGGTGSQDPECPRGDCESSRRMSGDELWPESRTTAQIAKGLKCSRIRGGALRKRTKGYLDDTLRRVIRAQRRRLMVVGRPQPSGGALFELARPAAQVLESDDTSLYRRVTSFTRSSTADRRLGGSRRPRFRHS